MADTDNEDDWVVKVVPYFWGTSLNGDVQLGSQESDVDAKFRDIIKDINFGLMGYLDARKGRVGYYINPVFARVQAEESVDSTDIDVTNDLAVFAAGAYYRALDTRFGAGNDGASRRLILEPYAGARWTYLRLEIDAKDNSQVDKSESWIDPYIGARMGVELGSKWDLALGGDVGGFGIGSDFSWNALASFGYHFKLAQRDTVFRFGYRALHYDYDTGSGSSRFEWNVTMHGPIAGLSLKF